MKNMAKVEFNRKYPPSMADKLEYAVELIELTDIAREGPISTVKRALFILQFGEISPKEFYDYLEATR